MSEATPSTPDFVAGSSASTQTLRDEPLNIVVDGVSFGPTLWTRLDIDIWHGALPRGECQRRPTRSEQIFRHNKKAAAPAGINDYEDDHCVRESA